MPDLSHNNAICLMIEAQDYKHKLTARERDLLHRIDMALAQNRFMTEYQINSLLRIHGQVVPGSPHRGRFQ